VQSSARVDFFVANSHNVSRQIKKYYRRSATVVHPPVDVDAFAPAADTDSYYLCVGQLVRYKRIDLAVEAFNALRAPLLIIGEGEEYKTLKRLAGPTITFVGHQESTALKRYYARCRALIFPGEEDFGIVPIEAMASGRPVIAFRRGGALETVLPSKTGMFFDRQTPASLVEAVRKFEDVEHFFEPSHLVEHARRYSKENFKRQLFDAIHEATQVTGIALPLHRPEDQTVVPLAPQSRGEPEQRRAAEDQSRWRV
jgi:glycosyltransferase involved in cell wall biosynthesis